jgi:hypothetical protein
MTDSKDKKGSTVISRHDSSPDKEDYLHTEDEKFHTHLYNEHIDVSGVDERKLVRKLDMALIPWLSLLYLLSFLDRTSIGNAKVRTSFSALGRLA